MRKKRCRDKVCGAVKPLTDFHVNNSEPDGRHYYCKDCQNRRAREWRERNIEKARERSRRSNRKHHLMRMYGITIAEYEAILRKQNNRCPICLKPLKRPSIDHCHVVGIVRGVLCRHCNSSLSVFEQDTDAIGRLAAYLGVTIRFLSNTRRG